MIQEQQIKKYLLFDTETSGFPDKISKYEFYPPQCFSKYENARMLELGFLIIHGDKEEEIDGTSILIKPQGFIWDENCEAGKKNGIKNSDLEKNGVSIEEALNIFEQTLDTIDVLVAHNLNFDYKIITSECLRLKKFSLIDKMRTKEMLCTCEYARRLLPEQNCHKVEILYNQFKREDEGENFKETIQSHRALDDCRDLMYIYFKLRNIENKNKEYEDK